MTTTTPTPLTDEIMARHHVEVPEPTPMERFKSRVMYNVDAGRNYVEYVSLVDAVEIVQYVEALEAFYRDHVEASAAPQGYGPSGPEGSNEEPPAAKPKPRPRTTSKAKAVATTPEDAA